MSDRRPQFNIGAQHFSDEVYEFVLSLSKKKKLSAWIAKHAEDDLRRNEAPMGNKGNNQVLDELREIKAMLQRGSFQHRELPSNEVQAVIQKITSDEPIVQMIDASDLDYNF